MTEPSDEQRVELFLKGEESAYQALYVRYKGRVAGIIHRMIRDHARAEDLTQEVFIQVYSRLKDFKGKSKFFSWLYRIALNLCRDWIRRQRRAPVVQMPEGVDPLDLATETGPVESIEDLVSRRELSAVVEEAMKLLPEEQRTAIILKEYHGMTFQEIADLQGCPLSTVKTRLYQGLSVLRRHLEKNGRMAPQLVKRA